MTRWALILTLCGAALGCASHEPEPVRRVTPGARIIYSSGVGDAVWAICDKGDRIIMTEKSAQLVVIPGGCPSGQP